MQQSHKNQFIGKSLIEKMGNEREKRRKGHNTVYVRKYKQEEQDVGKRITENRDR